MKHMPLEEWDRTVAPILGAITIRTGWITRDLKQIEEWLQQLPYTPAFETEAAARLREITLQLAELHRQLTSSMMAYEAKEKVS